MDEIVSTHTSRGQDLIAAREADSGADEPRLIPEADPLHSDPPVKLANIASQRRNWAELEATSRKLLETDGEDRRALWWLGMSLRKQSRPAEAADVLRKIVDLGGPIALNVYAGLAYCLHRIRDFAGSERILRLAIADFPDDAGLHTQLAQTLVLQNRLDEAIESARRALELDPGQYKAQDIVAPPAPLPIIPKEKRQRWARWPEVRKPFSDFRKLVKEAVLGGYPMSPAFIASSTKFMTVGSCFAHNLALLLKESGFTSHHEMLSEEVNTTFANRYLFEWVANGVTDAPTASMERAYGEAMRERLQSYIEASDAFIFTLGVAPSSFQPETGEFYFAHNTGTNKTLQQSCVSRMTTVDENADNVARILEIIRSISNRNPNFVLTVSPVPLKAAASGSAVISDCLSKSTLRLACEQVRLADTSGRLHYWPSFEIVKWLGAHVGPENQHMYYSAPDDTRHVSPWVVDIVTSLFLEIYGVSPGEAARGNLSGAKANGTHGGKPAAQPLGTGQG